MRLRSYLYVDYTCSLLRIEMCPLDFTYFYSTIYAKLYCRDRVDRDNLYELLIYILVLWEKRGRGWHTSGVLYNGIWTRTEELRNAMIGNSFLDVRWHVIGTSLDRILLLVQTYIRLTENGFQLNKVQGCKVTHLTVSLK